MKKLIYLLFFISSVNLTAQNMGEWTWMKGSNLPNSQGVFGTKGIPDTANYPPGLYEACSWTDTAGNFWLFGGVSGQSRVHNDLWKYNTQNNTWTWLKGNSVINDAGNYGIKGIPSSTNLPPSRGWGVMSWTDNDNNFWLYGGRGTSIYQDLWKYNVASNEWTWVSGTNTPTNTANYGIKGVPSINNYPPHIEENNCIWVDNSNNLWFFGGYSFDISVEKYFNDLWKYDVSTNEWTWINGNASSNIPASYGQKGVDDSTNNPGGRACYASFVDINDNFYLFGSGNDFFSSNLSRVLNDIWKYDKNTKNWTWISGENTFYSLGLYGASCLPSNIQAPRSRYEVRSIWIDTCGFWIYGGAIEGHGSHLSDFWRYNYINNTWTRISGSPNLDEPAIYGNYQISAFANIPGGRAGAVSWMDKKGNLWMFGGRTYTNFLADLWRFVPDTNCVKLCLPNKNPPIPEPKTDTLHPEIIIPNIFTPNADGLNDKFEIIAKNYKTYYLQVFNRWGVLVFETKDAAILWDGTMHNHGNACADGVYFYILNLHDFKQNTTQHKGSVTILR